MKIPPPLLKSLKWILQSLNKIWSYKDLILLFVKRDFMLIHNTYYMLKYHNIPFVMTSMVDLYPPYHEKEIMQLSMKYVDILQEIKPSMKKVIFKNESEIILSGKTYVFFTFLFFLHFRTRILTKNATCWAKNMVFELFYNVFGTQDA